MLRYVRRATWVSVLLMGSVSAQAANIDDRLVKIFDAPGAGRASDQGTLGIGINDFGVIAGITRDARDVRHGFLRHPSGTFTIFNCPNAGTAASQGTQVHGLNAIGSVVGTCRDANDFDLPYIRGAYGSFTAIEFPNLLGGNAWAINLWGAVVGNFLNLTDDQSVLPHYHGFLRSPQGVIVLFDPPGSVLTEIPSQSAITDTGAITGDYWDCNVDLSSCSVHGFVRRADGKYTVIDVPGAGPDGYSGQGTFPQGINDVGEVSGFYSDVNSIYHGFVRSASGSIATFDVPTTCSTAAPPTDCAFEGTFPTAVNLLGTVAGTYSGEDGVLHGFSRAADGSIIKFDVSRAGYQTYPLSLNDFGQVTGVAYDANFVNHALIAFPADTKRRSGDIP